MMIKLIFSLGLLGMEDLFQKLTVIAVDHYGLTVAHILHTKMAAEKQRLIDERNQMIADLRLN